MRKKLKTIEGFRKKFRGKFVRFGTKSGWEGREITTLLLEDVVDLETKKKVTDHIWFTYTKGFQQLELKEGCIVEFNARVKKYVKGYKGYREDVYKPVEIDYKLSHPSKIIIV